MEESFGLPTDIRYCNSNYRQFMQGERHIDRITDEYVLLFMLRSTLHFTEDESDVALRAGQWYIQRPGLPQRGRVGSPAPYYYYIHFIGAGGTERMPFPVCGLFESEFFLPLFDRLLYCNNSACDNPFSAQEVFLKLIGTLWESVRRPATRDALLASELLAYLEQNFARTIEPGELEHRFNYSRDHLSEILRRERRITPKAFLTQKRMEKAKEMLAMTDTPVSEVCRAVGYADDSVFYKAFRTAAGLSPRAYRRASRGFRL